LGLVTVDGDVEIASSGINILEGEFFCEADQGVKKGIKTDDSSSHKEPFQNVYPIEGK
jgi:hypothetical protein